MTRMDGWNRRMGAGMAAALMAAALIGTAPVYAAGETGIDMSTDYPGITVKAGETVSFPLDFASLDGEGYDVALTAEDMPENWTGYFKGGNNQVTKVHVNADEAASDAKSGGLADFSLTVPAEAEEGVYKIGLKADGLSLIHI